MSGLTVENILGWPIASASEKDCLDLIATWIENRKRPRYFVCANPHSIFESQSDECFREAVCQADLVTPDGIGIVLASLMLGGNIRRRITGSDVFLGVSARLNEIGSARYFFLGSTEATLRKIRARMAKDFPRIDVVGTYSPPFSPNFTQADNQTMLAQIHDSTPDVLWVGMTAPKQEKWIFALRDRLNVPFVGAIGAVFDFYAENIRRSHPIFQRMGLEWLPRLVQEPRRLWRRNFVSNPAFVYLVLRQCAMTMRDKHRQ